MSGALQTGYAPPTGPAPTRRRGWLLAATVAWALLLAALVWLSVRDDPPTVREQRSLAEAGPLVDRAVGELTAAAGASAVLELTPPRVEPGCRVTPFADGASLRRGVEVAAPGDGERAVLERIAERLPAGWRAGVRMTTDGPRLRADAGEFVAVEGRPTGDGRLRLTADTGCRPVGSGYAPATGPAGAEAAALAEALRALGRLADAAPDLVTAPCPGGGLARSARAEGGAAAPTAAATALGPLANGGPVLDIPEAYAYRTGPVTVLADTGPSSPHVAATLPCP
ncbi:hypothetical protein [Micromonospora sp. WMMD812]|uniref:hypothetical protein n=1 Tax=Micromonospora sp. WMMD812 TaxID=3015152 RepID=UPI00248A9303|nr:hypothetical protein [Micromonospora sp. WMMD812]WBB66196.1 hypothetical protein O7603_23940 [Micromonospora sp. WMMD812]